MGKDQRRRASRSVVVVAALVVGSVLTAATAGTATGTGGKARPPTVRFTEVFTNDDGRINGVDAGDVGDTSLIFDVWGRKSSDDPPSEGFGATRLDKDVARCTAWISKKAPHTAKVRILNAYPGYVCTVSTTLTNVALLPLDLDTPTMTSDPGLSIADVSTAPTPEMLIPGDSATFAYSIRVEQSADQNDRIQFDVAIDLTKSTTPRCAPLNVKEIPLGATLIAKRDACISFLDEERDGACGPAWSEEAPYAWHFVAAWIGKKHPAELTVVLNNAGIVGPAVPSKVTRVTQHFWVYTESPDVLRGAYIDRTVGWLALANTCHVPDEPSG